MTKNQIISIQKKIGTKPDGVWGRKSQDACEKYLRSLMPIPPVWPIQAKVGEMFGKAGDENNLVNLDVSGLGVKYEGTTVHSIRCHRLVADSLGRILLKISQSDSRAILSNYGGCFNYRPRRGGNTPSMHSWGITIDLDPDSNGMKDHWPKVATMPFEVVEIFAREGWKSLGAFANFDAMHFQATR